MTSGLDLLLGLLAVPGSRDIDGEEIRGITRLQKLLFLILMEDDFKDRIDTDFIYHPYNFGPYSSVLLSELEALRTAELVTMEKARLGSIMEMVDRTAVLLEEGDEREEEKFLEIYRITERGMRVWNGLVAKKFTPEEIKHIVSIKRRFNDMAVDDLIRHVYERYPDYTTRSKIIEEVFGLGIRPDLTPFDREE